LKRWEKLLEKVKTSRVGDMLYSENDLVSRIARDVFNEDIDEFIVNDEDLYHDIFNYVTAFGDYGSSKKIKLYTDYEDIFDGYGVTIEIEKALEKIVYLECGGYLIIESTEALTTIDVNTGKNIGRDALKIGLENTTLQTNLEAAKEIPRQLMLRNIGGIIIIDFIDMKEEKNRDILLTELEKSLKIDRVKNSIIHFTDLNLVEMTRKRTGNPLNYYYYDNCPMCNGKGKIKSPEALVEDILREIRVIMEDDDFTTLKISAERELFKKIREEYFDFIESYTEKRKKRVILEEIRNRDISKWYEITLVK
ncbi:MAG: ribonuclease E/G, partial [Fusobacteriaceae bacterium]